MRAFPLRLTLCTLFLLAAGCSPATPTAEAVVLRVQYTFAAQPWLVDLSNCAGNDVIQPELRAADYLEPNSVNLVMRIGEDPNSTLPSYQIGTEEIIVIVNPQNPTGALTAEEVRGLFSGQIQNWQEINSNNAPVQVWAFSSEEDIQRIFDEAVLDNAPPTSLARLASDPEKMAQAVAADVGAVGLLTWHWKTGEVSAAFSAVTVPVLAITPTEPQGALADLLACLQK